LALAHHHHTDLRQSPLLDLRRRLTPRADLTAGDAPSLLAADGGA
jgi:hypothetical protein